MTACGRGVRGALALLMASAVAHAGERADSNGEEDSLPTPRGSASAQTVGLEEAVRWALARNPTAIVANEEVRRAEAILEETRSNALPTLSGNFSYTRLDGDRTQGGVVVAYRDQLNANAVLSVPIVVPKPWAQWAHASDVVDVSKATESDTRRIVAVAVARAYLAVVAQKRVLDVAERARDTDRAHYEFAHQRFVGGVGNRIDEVRAEQQLRSDEVNVEQQVANLTRDREALGLLVGVDRAIDTVLPELHAPSSPAEAARDASHRSDVVAARARLRAGERVVHDDWTDYSPYVTGLAEPFWNTPPTTTLPSTGWQAELLLTVPLYDGGLRYGLAKERDALRAESRAMLDATVRQAQSDVRTAFEEIRRADIALESARRAGALAAQGRELASSAYRAGASTNIEVIDAERTARDAETAVAIAEDGARQARLDLLAATGRFP
ncbi:MAG: TolC family protein [Polyangiaceae bacterium]|jgi:outer membrane protein TolC